MMISNYKVVNKGDFTTVTYRQKDALQVNQREMALLERNMMPGFMKPKLDTANEMTYLAPTSIPLKKFLAKDCTVEKVCNVFLRIIGAMHQVTNNHMMMQNLLIDPKYIFVRGMSNEVYLIYEPYVKNVPQVDVLAFFMSVIAMAKIKDKSEQVQLEQFRQFVASHDRLEDVERYINQALQGRGNYDYTEDEGTTVLGYEDEGTTVLNSQDDYEPETTILRREPILSLVRTKDGSVVQLTGTECTIGRAADNYIAVRDNTDVSRYHAAITISNGAYYVTDCGSKNGTTLNGRDIMANAAEPIQNGDVLEFGGEEFTFVVEG